MRRILLLLAALVMVVTAFAAFAGPVMARDDLNCRDARGYLIRCDGQLYTPYDRYDRYPSYYNDRYDRYPYYYNDRYPYYYDDDYYDDGYYDEDDCWEYSWVFEEWQWDCD